MNSNKNVQQQPSRIIGIQFGLLSPESIKRNSVVQIESRDTYINNKPVTGGLFDPRMGVLEPGLICPTDGLTYIDTPGYFGHIELARPVFFIQHLKEILKIIKCICFKCSKLKINKSQHLHALKMQSSQRWDYVYGLASGVKRCGDATEDGCGCKQPDRIKQEGIGSIYAIWDNISTEDTNGIKDTTKITMKLTPENIIKIFRRISDDDINFMGFSPIWSRPEWMVCSVLPVPPPAVRPSVKHDAQQRSEDDLTHIYSNIIKTNKDLLDKIQNNASPNVIEGLTAVLQYLVAMIVNNKVKGAIPMSQRSGRPLQCISGRLNSKNGRIRGNLMGKRVDFSARSVITGDPNLSIRQLGVPLKVAKNITKPVVVNERNRDFLMKLIQNGPDVHPGAKILEKKNGDSISLRYVDRDSIRLEDGDIVHRHMMDGDAVLFNRQPSLHRVSMMCHIVKVMKVGDTFRINVGVTKPYNADFDGDEMNMHMPQNVLAETELRHLAAIPYQMISPSGNAPIIGIYQDSQLGSYRFTREKMRLTPRKAMNLLMAYSRVNADILYDKRAALTNFDVLSQIIPPLTLRYSKGSNKIAIQDGEYISGQMEKSVLASTSKGIIHRVYNDYGYMPAANFVDDLQGIITEYMKTSSFSVGISDLIANKKTQESIVQVVNAQKLEVQSIIQKVHLGIFKNETANSNSVEFEKSINNILNKATEQSGKIGRESLSRDNRFLIIVESGSKGSLVNISQMIACVGQQNVDGKRVPYGFDSRTLPHFTKFDDSEKARGFVENSYISGLTAPELFFHAMGGRIGLIDTAVKSVTWETPIVLIEKGKPIYTEIGRWIDAQLAGSPDKVQHFAERNMELLNVDGLIEDDIIYIPTTDEDGKVTWGEITAVTRHDPGTELYEIKTAGGRSVTVTESKSLLIWNPETKKLKEMATPDIKVGDCVPVTGELCEPPVVLDELLPGATYPIVSPPLKLTKDNGVLFGQDLAKGHIEKYWNYFEDDISTICYVPSEIFIANKEFIRGLMNGFYMTSSEIVNNEVHLITNFPRLSEGLSMLLSRLNIYSTMKKTEANGHIVIIPSMFVSRFFESIDRPVENWMTDLNSVETYNDVVLDPIVEINIIGVEKHPKVYDLTIPSTLNFGLANGLQVRDTSQTGYIQRRLIKSLEDKKVENDMTVRNNMGKIIQFAYGDDGFDSTKVENQTIPLVGMSIEDIYMHYDLALGRGEVLNVYTKGAASRISRQAEELKVLNQSYIENMIYNRDLLVENIFKFRDENSVSVPVAFHFIIANIGGQLKLGANSTVDITPLEAYQLIESYMTKLEKLYYSPPTPLFKILYNYYLSPRELLINKRFHRKALEMLLETIVLKYKQALVHPGEMVGVIAGQSIGEPTTQLTLNSVTYETEILVRNSKKEVKCVQIGEFTQEHIYKSQKIDYNQAKDMTYAELSEVDEYYEVPCATENGETVWRRIEAVTKHPVINEDGTNTMLKVTTQGCHEVIATKAKSFLQLVDGKIIGVNGKDLKVGQYLPVSKKPLDYTESFELSIKEILPPKEYLYGSEYKKAEKLINEHHWWHKHSGKDFVLPHSRSDSFISLVKSNKNIHENCVYMKLVNMCDYRIPEKIELDYDFGYFLGAYCAEGCMTKHQMSISNNDLEYLKPIQRLCEKFNVRTKVYRVEDKNEKGWVSQDVRIYNTVLCRIVDKLCGKLSHNKFVSSKIVYSNRECIKGFLDAYIGGDGYVSLDTNDKMPRYIEVSSVSMKMLLDVSLMLRNLGIVSKISKPKKQEKNNRGSLNIRQNYILNIRNKQAQKLAPLLNLPIKAKQERLQGLIERKFNYEYSKDYLTVPNMVDGEIVFEPRDNTMPDLIFEKIISIEEVPNTTDYAYDLTVFETRTFDTYYGLTEFDTFHLAGVASKSNVTRGVPRIEEILRLTKNPKNPSLTIHIKDEENQERATSYATMLEHTKLVDVVKSVKICFDPNDNASFIEEDRGLIEQYYEFEKIVNECNQGENSDLIEGFGAMSISGGGGQAPALYSQKENIQKSKWIIRMEFNAETMLDKNITMDDIHFAIQAAYGQDISCIYSDFNMENLVFRIRLNSDVLKKKKATGTVQSLDQSDDIYLLKNFQDTLLNHIVLRGISGIQNVIPRKLQNMVTKQDGKYVKKDMWILDTTGTNLLEALAVDFIDYKRTYSNDIREVFNVLGIEAARQVIYNEFVEVMEFSGVYINYHHLSLLCDRMTLTTDMVPIFRSGILNDDIGPLAKATFEVHTEVFLDAARHGEFDDMRGVSANVMCGQYGKYGTNMFNVILDMAEMVKLKEANVTMKTEADEIEELFGYQKATTTDACTNIEIHSNISTIAATGEKICDDGYDMGF